MKKGLSTILMAAAVTVLIFNLQAAETFTKDKEFENSQLSGKNFTRISSFAKLGLEAVDDADAAGGKAMALKKHPKGTDLHNSKDFQIGIYCEAAKKNLARKIISKKDLPQDEKYHVYHIGKVTLSKRTIFFAHRSWAMQQQLYKFFDANDANKNLVDAYVSVKFTGPAYVKNSTKENGIFIDRIVLLHVGLPTRKSAESPLPEFLQGKIINDFSSGEFFIGKKFAQSGLKLTADPEACNGKAMMMGAKANNPDFHKKPFMMGIYSNSLKKNLAYKKLKADEIARDEKYHIIPLGKIKLQPNLFFWGHASWLMQQPLTDFAKNAGSDECEVMVSIKFTGPSYVPGSTSADAVYIDRILFIR